MKKINDNEIEIEVRVTKDELVNEKERIEAVIQSHQDNIDASQNIIDDYNIKLEDINIKLELL